MPEQYRPLERHQSWCVTLSVSIADRGELCDCGFAEIDSLRELLAKGVEAFRLTREYVGVDELPALPGWSWYDWTQEARQKAFKQVELIETSIVHTDAAPGTMDAGGAWAMERKP